MNIVLIWIKKTAYYAMQAVNVLATSMWFFAVARLIFNVVFEDFSDLKVFTQFFIPVLIGVLGVVVFSWLYKLRNFFGVK
jgi:hypothetical protein